MGSKPLFGEIRAIPLKQPHTRGQEDRKRKRTTGFRLLPLPSLDVAMVQQ